MIAELRRHGALAALAALGAGAIASAAPSPAAPQYLSRGDRVPAFEAERLDGGRRQVSFAKGSATVLLFFLSSCPTCHKMIPEWNRAYARRSPRLEVVGVLMDREPPGFFSVLPVDFPVIRSPGREFARTFRVERVPLTIRVEGGGLVDDVGAGLLDPIRLSQLFRP
jgi:hypothetical protein